MYSLVFQVGKTVNDCAAIVGLKTSHHAVLASFMLNKAYGKDKLPYGIQHVSGQWIKVKLQELN